MRKVVKSLIFIMALFILSSCNKVKITFDYNCDNDDKYICDVTNSKIDCTVPTPTCKNHEFLGWYEEKENGNLVDLTKDFNESIILYAHYNLNEPIISPSVSSELKEIEYTVSFNLNGGMGDSINSVKVLNGNIMPEINKKEPTREGYTFMGWYDNSDYLKGIQYYNSKCESKVKYTKKSDTILYAGWSKNGEKNYTVTYISNNGNEDTIIQSAVAGKSTTLSKNTFTKLGYQFKNWNTKKDGSGKIYSEESSIVVNKDIKIYAIYEAITYNIEYSLVGATLGSNAPTSAVYNKMIKIDNPSKKYTVTLDNNGSGSNLNVSSLVANQSFEGWTYSNGNNQTAQYKNNKSNNNVDWTNENTKVNADQFKNLRTENGTVKLIANFSNTLVTLPNISKNGYTCGYSTKTNSNEIEYLGGNKYTPTSDVKLYVVCTSTPLETNKIHLDKQGGSGGSTDIVATYGITLPSIEVPTKKGYIFEGYYSSKNGTNIEYYNKNGISNNKWNQKNDITIYAKWTAKQLTIIYHKNDIIDNNYSDNYVYDGNMDDNYFAPKTGMDIREGYTFKGWSFKKDGSDNIRYKFKDTIGDNWFLKQVGNEAKKTISLYAIWEPIKITVKYECGSGTTGSAPGNVTATFGQTFTTSKSIGTCKKTGYSFSKWYDPTGDHGWTNWSGTWSWVNGKYGITNNTLTLTAQWTKNEYTIKYDCGNGTSGTAPANQKVLYENIVTIAKNAGSCVKPGYTFSKWYDPTGDHGWTNWSGKWAWENGKYGITNNTLTLTAQWIPNKYTISFDCNGGTKPSGKLEPKEIKYGEKYTLPSDLCTKKGSTQIEWRDQKNVRWTSSNTVNWTWTYDYNPTLKAQWTTKEYTIKYECGDGATGTPPSNQKVLYGNTVTIAKNVGSCVKSGYKFNKWYDPTGDHGWTNWSGKWEWENGKYGIKNNTLTLKAQWTAEEYTIKYECGDGATGTPPSNQKVLYGNTVTIAKNAGSCVKSGYKFNKWYDPTGDHGWTNWSGKWEWGNGKYGIENNTLTLKAQWVKNTETYTIKYYCDFSNLSNTPYKTQTVSAGDTITIAKNDCPNNADNKAKWYDPTGDSGWTNWTGKWTYKKGQYGINDDNVLILTSVPSGRVIDHYYSNTLRYWIEKYGDEKNRTANNNYLVTHIWVNDSYNQLKMAITKKKSENQTAEIPRTWKKPYEIMQDEISEKSLNSKGLVAINASPMIGENFDYCSKCTDSNWIGTARIPLKIHDGKIIRNSTLPEEVGNVTNDITLYMLGQDGILTYKHFDGRSKDASDYNTIKNSNEGIYNTIINTIKPKYTFGFAPVLLSEGNRTGASRCTSEFCVVPNLRQSICQIDKNNFITITTLSNDQNNRNGGLTIDALTLIMLRYNCKVGMNLDGGGSTSYFYKKNNSTLNKINGSYYGRKNVEMLYFVEQ